MAQFIKINKPTFPYFPHSTSRCLPSAPPKKSPTQFRLIILNLSTFVSHDYEWRVRPGSQEVATVATISTYEKNWKLNTIKHFYSFIKCFVCSAGCLSVQKKKNICKNLFSIISIFEKRFSGFFPGISNVFKPCGLCCTTLLTIAFNHFCMSFVQM